MKKSRLIFGLLSLVCGFVVNVAAAPMQTGKVLVVPQGQNGAEVGEFVTVSGAAAREKTSARVLWDAGALTVAFDCDDQHILATHPRHDDSDMWRDDCVELFLDPGHTHRADSKWFHVLVSAAGGVYDEQGPVQEWFTNGEAVSGNRAFTAGHTTTHVALRPGGWTARITVPWTDIGARPRLGEVWGFNLNRSNHPEEDYLCYSPTAGSFYHMNQWGHLVFADNRGLLGADSLAQLTSRLLRDHARIEVARRTIGGVLYDAIDPGEPFVAAPRPVQNWHMPQPFAPERAAGMLAYVTGDPGDYKPWSTPKVEEHVKRLDTFLTRGADEAAWVGVRGLTDLRGLNVQVATGAAPLTVDVRSMHFWPQRTGWQSHKWYITPELLLSCANGKVQVPARRGLLQERPFNVAAGTTAALWLTVHTAPNARPGLYPVKVSIQARGRPPLLLPWRIEVLPFSLQRPHDRNWTLYCDQDRWAHMNERQVMAELRDFARHGVTGLNSIGLGRADYSGLAAGRVTFDASSYRRIVTMAAQAGIPGPHVVHSWSAEEVRNVVAPGVDLGKGVWPEAVRNGVVATARAAVEATRGLPGWYYYGVDEPRGTNTFALQDYRAWHDGGAATYATVYDADFLAKAASCLSAPCYGSNLIGSEAQGRAANAACSACGAKFWWYGIGCYVNPFPQEGMMAPNRYGAGLFFRKCGATGQAIWTYCRPHGDVFNDFDGVRVNRTEPKEQCLVYPHLLKADDWSTYQGAIPTIAWEAVREGADDYAYIQTLELTISAARQHPDPAVRSRAATAASRLQHLMDAVPWANAMDKPVAGTRQLTQIRRAVADEIVRLRQMLAGKPRS